MAKSLTLRAKETSHPQKTLGSHLVQPFVYIKQVHDRQPGQTLNANHSEKYNPSNNAGSKRKNTSIAKQSVTL